MQSINPDNDKKDGIRQRVKAMETTENYQLICPPPKSLKIEVSASCNLACSFCYHQKSGRNGMMSMDDFLHAITIAAEHKIPQVGLLFLGESTLNPLLPEFIRMAKEEYHIPYVFLTSNGVMSKKTLYEILDTPLDSLKWSINQYDRNSFYRETRANAFDTVMWNVHFAKEKAKWTKLYASTAVYDVNHIPEKMKVFVDKEIKPYVYEHYYFQINNQGGLMQDSHFCVPYCNRLPVIPCPRLFNNSYITYDLKVALCCSAFTKEFILGDLHKERFMEIWNGERMQKLRKAHLEGDVSKIICGGHHE